MHNQAPNSDSSNISRHAAFPLKIQGGMLEALGINMYATIGKCLVEFVANAFDSEATTVDIVIPTGDIKSRSEEHTSELQSLMRISYAVFCLKKKQHNKTNIHTQ